MAVCELAGHILVYDEDKYNQVWSFCNTVFSVLVSDTNVFQLHAFYLAGVENVAVMGRDVVLQLPVFKSRFQPSLFLYFCRRFYRRSWYFHAKKTWIHARMPSLCGVL